MDFFILCFYASVFIAPASILAGVAALVKIRKLRKIYGPIIAAERELARINKDIQTAKAARDKMIADNSEMLGRFRERQERERTRLEMTEEGIQPKAVFTRATTTLNQPEASIPIAPARQSFGGGDSEIPARNLPFPQRQSAAGLHRQRVAVAAASSVGAIATFLPWAYAPIFGSMIGSTMPEGWICLILFLPSMILAFAGNIHTPLYGPGRVISTVTAGLSSACGIWTIADFEIKLREQAMTDSFEHAFMMTVQMGPGVYLSIASGLAVIILAWTLDGELGKQTRSADFRGRNSR